MKQVQLGISILAIVASINVLAANKVTDETSLQSAIAMANTDSSIHKIVFAKNAQISLTSPVIYTGTQNLTLLGNGAILNGENVGTFILDNELIAHTTDATLVFNTSANISINELAVLNSATQGIVINVPDNAQGDDIQVSLHKVEIRGSALHGLHIDDNTNEFDDGDSGSELGIELSISHSSFIGNGIGAIDFDGIRVDERGPGDIHASINNTHIDGNGGDGLELDEGGIGNVDATIRHVTFNDNGFYNQDDLDDGFDIDEAGPGDIEVSLFKVLANRNKDEGIDFDEVGAGSVKVRMRRVIVMDTVDEGIKIDEHELGNVDIRLINVMVMDGDDDGIQVTEQGEGYIAAELKRVSATGNKKYGVIIEQWNVEDEKTALEESGTLKVKELTLSGNGGGDELQLHNVFVE